MITFLDSDWDGASDAGVVVCEPDADLLRHVERCCSDFLRVGLRRGFGGGFAL